MNRPNSKSIEEVAGLVQKELDARKNFGSRAAAAMAEVDAALEEIERDYRALGGACQRAPGQFVPGSLPHGGPLGHWRPIIGFKPEKDLNRIRVLLQGLRDPNSENPMKNHTEFFSERLEDMTRARVREIVADVLWRAASDTLLLGEEDA